MCLIAFEKGCTNIKKDAGGDPVWAYVSVTDYCDRGCRWCYAKNQPYKGKMSAEQFAVVLGRCREIGIRQVSLSGGEPTLHPQIVDLIKMSAAAGFKTHLLTHGLTRQFAEMTEMSLPLRQVQFNWNTDSFRALIPVVKQVKARKGAPVVAVTIVGSVENVGRIGELLDAAEACGVDKIRIWDQTGPTVGQGVPSIRDYYELVKPRVVPRGYTSIQSYDPDVQDDDIEVKINCLLTSKSTLFIASNGDIVPCLCSRQHQGIVNVLEADPQVILQKHREFCDSQEKGRCFARGIK